MKEHEENLTRLSSVLDFPGKFYPYKKNLSSIVENCRNDYKDLNLNEFINLNELVWALLHLKYKTIYIAFEDHKSFLV